MILLSFWVIWKLPAIRLLLSALQIALQIIVSWTLFLFVAHLQLFQDAIPIDLFSGEFDVRFFFKFSLFLSK